MRPAYCSAKTNQAIGTTTMPRYRALAQKYLAGKSRLTNRRASPNTHTATPSMSNANGVPPTMGRRLHA